MVAKRDLEIILNTEASWEKLRGKNVLVTGASGRLGMYIAQALLAANDRWGLGAKALLLARSRSKLEKEYGPLLEREDVRCLVQDVTEPMETEEAVDYIFHTAGLASPDDFTNRCIETLWGHVQGTKNVLDLAAEKGTEKVLYISTVEIYGSWDRETGIKETDMGPLYHNSFRACYPEAKRLCETMLACYRRERGVKYGGVRMSHTLGPGVSLRDGRAFAEFIRCALNGEDIVLQTDGSAMRPYTYVADAVGAMYLVLLDGEEGFYNVANLKNMISVRELAELIASLSPSGKTKVRYAAETGGKLAYLPFKLATMDCGKIAALGWRPQAKVEDVFRWTVESFL